MIVRIEKATRNVEETLNNNDLQNKLNELSRAIESYEAVDCEEFEKVNNNFTLKMIIYEIFIPIFHLQCIQNLIFTFLCCYFMCKYTYLRKSVM